jgi:Holliday junction resolvase RusA-like endonuclease
MKAKDGRQFVGKMKTSKGKRTESELMTLLMEHRPPEPFEGPVSLIVAWDYPWRKAEPKKNRGRGFRWCSTRPDCDNILKLLQDVMSRLGFWHDDSQVAKLVFGKRWADCPGIYVSIKPLEG